MKLKLQKGDIDAAAIANAPSHSVDQVAQKTDHGIRDGQAQHHADGSGQQIVNHALGHKHLHQVAALHTNGAGNAHLGAALGGQHDKD